MKKLENMAQSILEAPSRREFDFLRLSQGASPIDQLLAIEVDRAARTNPDQLENLKSGGKEERVLPPVILAAQEHVAAAAERNLDDLQLALGQKWPAMVKLGSVLVGVAGAGGLGALAGFRGVWSYVLIVVIGAGAGLFAPRLYDLGSILTRARDSQA